MKALTLTGHERPLTYLQFNPDGDLLFSCGKDGKLNCWQLTSMRRLGRYNTEKGMISNCDVNNDSTRLLATTRDSKVMIFDIQSGALLTSITESGPISFAEWNRKPDQQDRFVVSQDAFGAKIKCCLKLYKRDDLDKNKYDALVQISDFKSKCTRVRWGPFDKTIISSHDDGRCMVWDADTGELIKDFRAHDTTVTDSAMSDDRLLLLTCSSDSTARLWETVNFTEIQVFKTDRSLNACAICPQWNAEGDKRRLHVALGGGQTAADVTTTSGEGKFQFMLYHMAFGTQLAAVQMHYSPINCLSFSPDGKAFATGAEEGNIRYVQFDDEYFKKIDK